MPEGSNEPEPSTPSTDAASGLPFPAACRARVVGDIADFSECLSQELIGCPHGIPFGESHFCRHPQHKEIVARTSGLVAPRSQ